MKMLLASRRNPQDGQRIRYSIQQPGTWPQIMPQDRSNEDTFATVAKHEALQPTELT